MSLIKTTKVQIGINSDVAPLVVTANTLAGAPIKGYNTIGNRIAELGNISADFAWLRLFLADGTTENVRFNTNGINWVIGDLGIGRIDPAFKLDVKDTEAVLVQFERSGV